MIKYILTLIYLCFINVSFAATYYISQSTGDDTRSAKQAQSPATPWKSVSKASGLKVGGIILFKRGDTWLNSTLQPGSSGITFGGYGKGALPVIDGGKEPAVNVLPSKDQKLTFNSLAFKRSKSNGVVAQFGHVWSNSQKGLMNSVIKNCHFFGGIVIQGSYNLIQNNIVDGKSNNGNGNGIWEHHENCHHNVYRANTVRNFSLRGIWTMIDTHHGLFENNIVYNCKLAGIDLDGAYYVVYNHIIKNNTIYNIETDAIELENAFDCLVTGNKMYQGGHAYIYVINYEKCTVKNGHGATNGIGAVLNTTLSNNVMIGGGKDEFSIAIGIHKAGGINVFNNTIYNFKSRFFDLDYESPSEVPKIRLVNNIFSTIRTPSWYGMINFNKDNYSILAEDSNNCFYNNGRTDIYTDRVTQKHRSLSEYKKLSGKAKGSISVNPMFISETNLRLSPKSPCRGSGKAIGQAANSRPAPNMGAY